MSGSWLGEGEELHLRRKDVTPPLPPEDPLDEGRLKDIEGRRKQKENEGGEKGKKEEEEERGRG